MKRFSCIGIRIMLLSAVLLLSACQSSGKVTLQATSQVEVIEDRSACVVGSVPERYAFDPFYEKFCDAGGIPVIISAEVDDLALPQAYDIITKMLAPIPEVRQELIAYGAYFAIIGKHEMQTTLPEFSDMDSEYWDQRARGLGGSAGFPITSTAEENLLCLPWDRYNSESITEHEFAHPISLMGFGDQFESLLEEFTKLYESAKEQGLWANTYAISNIQEYWAEGVQTYFSRNLQEPQPTVFTTTSIPGQN